MPNFAEVDIIQLVDLFVEMHMNNVLSKFKHGFKARRFHSIRKNLKAIKVVREFTGASGSEFLTQISRLEAIIGEWHDRKILVESLKDSFGKNSVNAIIEKLRSDLKIRKEEICLGLVKLKEAYG